MKYFYYVIQFEQPYVCLHWRPLRDPFVQWNIWKWNRFHYETETGFDK